MFKIKGVITTTGGIEVIKTTAENTEEAEKKAAEMVRQLELAISSGAAVVFGRGDPKGTVCLVGTHIVSFKVTVKDQGVLEDSGKDDGRKAVSRFN